MLTPTNLYSYGVHGSSVEGQQQVVTDDGIVRGRQNSYQYDLWYFQNFQMYPSSQLHTGELKRSNYCCSDT
jgi:hypothetical protein